MWYSVAWAVIFGTLTIVFAVIGAPTFWWVGTLVMALAILLEPFGVVAIAMLKAATGTD